MIEKEYNEMIKILFTPKDWNVLSNQDRAELLALSFIGYVARPKNIPIEILQKCIDAFNANRGKIENETEAIFQTLEKFND